MAGKKPDDCSHKKSYLSAKIRKIKTITVKKRNIARMT